MALEDLRSVFGRINLNYGDDLGFDDFNPDVNMGVQKYTDKVLIISPLESMGKKKK